MPGITKESKDFTKLVKSWTDLDCFNYLRDIKRELGFIPTCNDFMKLTKGYPGPFRLRFGSWKKFVELSGFSCESKKKISVVDSYCKEDLIKHLLKVWGLIGRVPRVPDFNKYEIPDWIPREKFGTWNDYLRAAKIPIYRHRTSPGKDFIISSFRNLISELGFIPTYKELCRRDFGLEFTVSLIVLEFGSYGKFLRGLGLKPNNISCKIQRLTRMLEIRYGKVDREWYADWLRNPDSGRVLPCDIYVPSLNVAIEYDDESHFDWSYYKQFNISEEESKRKLQSRRHLDYLRDKLCRENGVRLIRFSCKEPFYKKYILDRIEHGRSAA